MYATLRNNGRKPHNNKTTALTKSVTCSEDKDMIPTQSNVTLSPCVLDLKRSGGLHKTGNSSPGQKQDACDKHGREA